MKSILLIFLFMISIKAQEMVELKTPGSDKIVIKLMFFNGSKCDPQGKAGQTPTARSAR